MNNQWAIAISGAGKCGGRWEEGWSVLAVRDSTDHGRWNRKSIRWWKVVGVEWEILVLGESTEAPSWAVDTISTGSAVAESRLHISIPC